MNPRLFPLPEPPLDTARDAWEAHRLACPGCDGTCAAGAPLYESLTALANTTKDTA